MGFFDELGDNIVKTTKDLGKMAQNTGDITKLTYDKKLKEQELVKLYEKLGQKYFEEHENEESEEIQEIKAVKLRLKELEDQVMTIKGGKSCPKCGALVKNGAMYCSSCGEKINNMFEE